MTAAAATPTRPAPSPRVRGLLELLSSMRFAIALLTVISIASVIGTVLKQGEPVGNYVNQFGPFWAQLFLAVHLNAVYSAGWFLLIVAVAAMVFATAALARGEVTSKDAAAAESVPG